MIKRTRLGVMVPLIILTLLSPVKADQQYREGKPPVLTTTISSPLGHIIVDGPTGIKGDIPSFSRGTQMSWKNVTIRATGYTTAADECGNSDGITSSGVKAYYGSCAAPSCIPFGTIFFVEGIGYLVVEDRGGAINMNGSVIHLDILCSTKKEARALGNRLLPGRMLLEP